MKGMKVLHILYQSLPQISGSSIRSRDILMSQKEVGIDVVAVTAPFQKSITSEETLYGIKHYRTSVGGEDRISDKAKSFGKRALKFWGIFRFYGQLKRIVRTEKPDVLHAHAMFFCGLPAIWLGRKFNIPVVYEIRSLWMLKKQKSKQNLLRLSLERILYNIEKYVARKASRVVVISDGLLSELVASGIPEEKIVVIRNAVNTGLVEQFTALESKGEQSNDRFHVGYIGTLTPHEGIDMLIDAFELFHQDHPKTKLLIYGNGIEKDSICEQLEDKQHAIYKGTLNPMEVYKGFEQLDVIVNPRYKNKLTDSVTPLKPLEAMAYGKIFIGSDVGGIKELVKEGQTGFLFQAGNKAELVRTLKKVYNLNRSNAEDLRATAKDFVRKQKSWLSNAALYKALYNTLTR